jgi:hypothetical protein
MEIPLFYLNVKWNLAHPRRMKELMSFAGLMKTSDLFRPSSPSCLSRPSCLLLAPAQFRCVCIASSAGSQNPADHYADEKH